MVGYLFTSEISEKKLRSWIVGVGDGDEGLIDALACLFHLSDPALDIFDHGVGPIVPRSASH